ncbi:phage tail assembly chaperone G [Bacillus sp. FSL M8-0168]|uniref:phage tail assembly chaperone G n=1 Tax=Bacillus sp. FSL M8-0168 TaxID=2921614 RepID=UPI0030FD8F1A
MIKIELINEKGEKKTYTQHFINTRKFRSVLEFGVKVEDENNQMSDLEQLDEMIMLVANLFDADEVTYDTILDGVEGQKIAEVLQGIIMDVVGQKQAEAQNVGELRELKKTVAKKK